jgi:hypothetical protein
MVLIISKISIFRLRTFKLVTSKKYEILARALVYRTRIQNIPKYPLNWPTQVELQIFSVSHSPRSAASSLLSSFPLDASSLPTQISPPHPSPLKSRCLLPPLSPKRPDAHREAATMRTGLDLPCPRRAA